MTELARRGFLLSCLALASAPAIVRVSSLMPVKARAVVLPSWVWVPGAGTFKTVQAAYDWIVAHPAWKRSNMKPSVYSHSYLRDDTIWVVPAQRILSSQLESFERAHGQS